MAASFFSSALMTGTAYSVTVAAAPTGESCSITNGTGTVGSANVTNVAITCAAGSGASAPSDSYATASFQLGYFTRLNAVRLALGLNALAQSSALDTSSQAQALYNAVNFNPSTMYGLDLSTGAL